MKTKSSPTKNQPRFGQIQRRPSKMNDNKGVVIRPMDIDNLFTILARLSKLTKDDELMCTLEDFFDSYGETVLHKQFGNHHYSKS